MVSAFVYTISSTGEMYLWGRFAEVGYDEPTKVMDDVIAFDIGKSHQAAITSDNSLYVWGKNLHKEVGNNSLEPVESPIKVMDNVSVVFAGENGFAALDNNFDLYMWGQLVAYPGQYMTETTTYYSVPVKMTDLFYQYILKE